MGNSLLAVVSTCVPARTASPRMRSWYDGLGSGRGRLWTCPRLVESHCLLGCFILELYGAFVAKGRMPVDGILKAVDISGDRMFSLLGATGGPNGQAFLLAVTRASRSASGLVTLPVGLPFSDFSRAQNFERSRKSRDFRAPAISSWA